MAEHAEPVRKIAEPARTPTAATKARSMPHVAVLERRSKAALGSAWQLLDRRGAVAQAADPPAPTRAAGPQPGQRAPERNLTGRRYRTTEGPSTHDVRVHRNSSEPPERGALADARGSDTAGLPVRSTAPVSARAPRHHAPIQRFVMHKIIEGAVVYYSDLEPGKPHYKTKEEAQEEDAKLAADPDIVTHALYRTDKKSKKQTARRSNTPYSYAHASVAAAPDVTNQGPHTLGFAATEYRLQQRLENRQDEEIQAQVLSPIEFESELDDVGADAGITDDKKTRMLLDYKSIHAQYEKWLNDAAEPKRAGSRFHLAVRRLMQMDPRTTYGKNVKSSGHGERAQSRFGSHSIDPAAQTKFPQQERLERYYDMREDLFHSSDEETDRDDFESYSYKKITPTAKEERRKRRIKANPY